MDSFYHRVGNPCARRFGMCFRFGRKSEAGGRFERRAPEDGTVTIKLHTWYPKKTDNWDVAIAEFEKKYPNIKVEFVSAEDNNSNEYYKKLDLRRAPGRIWT